MHRIGGCQTMEGGFLTQKGTIIPAIIADIELQAAKIAFLTS